MYSYSQPPDILIDELPIPRLKRTLSGTSFNSRTIGMSGESRDDKIRQLDIFLKEYVNEDETIDEIMTQDENKNKFIFFYFIGRLNPPHQGHLETLMSLVKLANDQDSVPLILLGSGPGGIRTMDNPITFETKKDFIESKLGGRYIIQQMTNPAKNVSEYVQEGLGSNISNIVSVTINHIAGGKDEDANKLNFVRTYAEKSVKLVAPEAEVITGVIPMPADRSATKVRKDVYKTVLDGSGYDGWSQEYKDFYGEYARTIYNEILFPLNLQDGLTSDMQEDIINYIERSELPGTKKKVTTTRKKRSRKDDEDEEEMPKPKSSRTRKRGGKKYTFKYTFKKSIAKRKKTKRKTRKIKNKK